MKTELTNRIKVNAEKFATHMNQNGILRFFFINLTKILQNNSISFLNFIEEL